MGLRVGQGVFEQAYMQIHGGCVLKKGYLSCTAQTDAQGREADRQTDRGDLAHQQMSNRQLPCAKAFGQDSLCLPLGQTKLASPLLLSPVPTPQWTPEAQLQGVTRG